MEIVDLVHRGASGGAGVMMCCWFLRSTRQRVSPVQFQTARRCGARTKSGRPCRSPATKKGRCRLHGGPSGSGGLPGECNRRYRHGERTKAAIAERRKRRESRPDYPISGHSSRK